MNYRRGVLSEGLNPANLSGILGYDEDPQIVGTGVGGDDEKPDFLGIVGVRGAYQLFAIAKGYFGFAALALSSECLGLLIFAVADKILGKEDRFQVFHLHIGAFTLGRVFFEKNAETVLLGGEVVDVAFQTAAIEKRDHGLVALIKNLWRRRANRLFFQLS